MEDRSPAAQQAEQHTACTPEQIAARGHRKPVNLALQGGGSHGAFGWGVLDKLLEDDRLAVDAISATSAGAMNAVAMAAGFAEGGRDAARAKLKEFWREVSRVGMLYGPVHLLPWQKWLALDDRLNDLAPSYFLFQVLTHTFSPYQLNPLGLSPLRSILTKVVDFERIIRHPLATRLFINATNVRTGKIKVFENKDLSADVVLASACLPYLFHAVEIDGEDYWDGGFMGNPALFPLIYKGASRDIIVVHINPIVRKDVPTSAHEILDRMNEITFNSSLMREMRAIAFVSRLIDERELDSRRYSRMLIHAIRDDEAMSKYGSASKFSTNWHFLKQLRDIGRAAAAAWLERHFDDVGRSGTVDLAEVYL
ncbi:MAG TPA: patatin-like phospholipase family protein [Hyphomicrobiaceae bacterium]|nr:patatin-like phospholipase family protein [Hyphomicrobiaceae bacterium]